MAGRLDGRACVVTGAGGGIGRAIAGRLASEGAQVLVVDRELADAENACSAITSGPGGVEPFGADLADRTARDAVVPAALDRFGRMDVLVNNAADHGPRVAFTELSEDEWDRVLETNLTATAGLCRAAAGPMTRARRGAIVNISSVQERLPVATYAAYVASKGGISAFTRALAVELSSNGVRVNTVLPGVIGTDAFQATLGAAGGGGLRDAPVPTLLGRKGLPEEVAAAVAFLSGDDASFITGAELRVDGGRSLSREPDPFDAGFRLPAIPEED